MMRSYGHAANDRLPAWQAFLIAFFAGLGCWAVLGFAVFLILRMFNIV